MSTYSGKHYKLRASSPIPKSDSNQFVLHSFMAEIKNTDIDTCTSSIVNGSSFRGQGGSYTSASYSRLPLKGGGLFRAEISSGELYVEEGSY